MRGRVATASVGLSLVLHGAVALYIALGRARPPPQVDNHAIEVTTRVAPDSRGPSRGTSPPTHDAAPLPAAPGRNPSPTAIVPDRRAVRRASAPQRLDNAATPERARVIDLFATAAIARAVGALPIDPGGHLRRPTDSAAAAAESEARETVAARVRAMVSDGVARERAASGSLPPHWRDIERKLVQTFQPPLEVVKQESVVKTLAHQVLRAWTDGEPRVGTVGRGVDASVQTLPGTPEGLNIRSLPMEQALAIQARWGAPATSLSVEVEVTIDEEGRVTAARVTRPSGRRSFDRNALHAVEDAIRAGGAPDERRSVVTRWLVESSMAVAPPTSIGFRFDESGGLGPGATGWRKYIAPTYPTQQTVQSHVSLVAIER
ncbi:MAG: TonB family protein [bacterium]|nr:TonB family protein [bacterium]